MVSKSVMAVAVHSGPGTGLLVNPRLNLLHRPGMGPGGTLIIQHFPHFGPKPGIVDVRVGGQTCGQPAFCRHAG